MSILESPACSLQRRSLCRLIIVSPGVLFFFFSCKPSVIQFSQAASLSNPSMSICFNTLYLLLGIMS